MSSTNNLNVTEDFLDEDTEIPGQRYVLVSFLSPEKVLQKKELFFFEKFLHVYEVDWKVKNLEKYLADVVTTINSELDEKMRELEKNNLMESVEVCRKNRLSVDSFLQNYQAFVKKNQAEVTKTTLKESYDDFLYKYKTKLEDDFHAKNDFQTSMRGVKVRGVYSNPKEAELKAKKLQAKDKYHNIYMADMGKWTPWDPNPNEVRDQEYNNDQLNNLMKKYKENEDSREKFFDERVQQTKPTQACSMSLVSDEPTTSSASSNVSTSYDSMFQTQGDLVIQRKMAQESKDSKESQDSKE